MKNFKKIAVLADVYEMSKSKNITTKSRESEPIFIDRIFSLLDASKRNSQFLNNRRWVSVKWEETALLQLESGNFDWKEYALSEKELEAKNLKRSIKFPVKDSYTEAIQDGEPLDMYNDYILEVEKDIEIIKGISFKTNTKTESLDELDKELDEDLDELKSIIKNEGLGIRVSKKDTYKEVLNKIEEARK